MANAHNEWSDPVSYLRRALSEHQFALYCQPIAALSGVLLYPMAEILVRLREEEAALLPPGDFLPVLEHYGMMAEFDRWVVREALHRLSSGPEIPRFSINLSPQTIADPRFPDFFAEETLVHRVPAENVVFEIDEHDAAAAPSSVRRLCAAVGSLGAGILIDGFGRGQGKLASLALPCVQYVKLHGSLTRNLATDEEAVARVLQILRVANELGIAAIAECVESDEVLARLCALKVRYAQGFGICVPQSIDLVSELPAMRLRGQPTAEAPLVPMQGLLDLTLNPREEATWAR